MRWACLILVLYITTAVALPRGGAVACQVEKVGGFEQKVITYKIDNKTYAVNGQARAKARNRGWLDGKEHFAPNELLAILDEGLKQCQQ